MRKRIVFILCVALCALLIAFHEEAADAARQGFALWRDCVMPALLPFFICTALMQRVGALRAEEPAALLALAFLSGAPSGARLCGQLGAVKGPPCDLTCMAASLNAISPVYVCGAFASGMLGAPSAAIALVTAQLIAMLVCFALSLKELPAGMRLKVNADEAAPIPVLFVNCIRDAALSLLSICGAMVFFSVLVRLLQTTGALFVLAYPLSVLVALLGGDGGAAQALLACMLEVATGSAMLAQSGLSLRLTVTVAAFAFSFCGACVAAQSMLFYPVRLGKYLLIKFAQGAVAAVSAFLLYPLCFRGAQPAGAPAPQTEFLMNTLSAGTVFLISMASMGFVMLLCLAKRKKPAREAGQGE